MSDTAWTRSLAEYVSAFAQTTDPLTDEQLRRIEDAMTALRQAHYAVLARSAERAARNGART